MEIIDFKSILGTNEIKQFIKNVLVKNIHQYNSEIEIDFKMIKINQIIPFAHFAHTERMKIAKTNLSKLIASNLTPYEIFATHENGIGRIVFPPIVEKINDDYYLIDGIHRLLIASEFGFDDVLCVAAKTHDNLPLPCTPNKWGNIEITDTDFPIGKNLLNINRQYFRRATECFNSQEFIFKSEKEFSNIINNYFINH